MKEVKISKHGGPEVLELKDFSLNNPKDNEVTIEHYRDLGRIMFGFTVFWAYIAGFQYYLIWYGNLPEEIEWYLARSHGTWMNLSYLLIFGHFVIPFMVLLFNKAKRVLSIMAILSILILENKSPS